MKKQMLWVLLCGVVLGVLFAQCSESHDLKEGAVNMTKTRQAEKPYVGKWKAVSVKIRAPELEDPDEQRLLESMMNGAMNLLELEIFRDYSFRAQFFDEKEVGNYRVYGDGQYLRLLTQAYESQEIELEVDAANNSLSMVLPAVPMPMGEEVYDLVLECKMERER